MSTPTLLPLVSAAALAMALLPAQNGVPAYPERDILSPFRNPGEIYAPPDGVYRQLRIMRELADSPATIKRFDSNGVEVVDDERWQKARQNLAKLGIDAGYLAQIMRTSRNADERDLAFYGMFFCSDPAYVINLIAHIPGEPQPKTREHAYPRAIAFLQAHLGRQWRNLSDAERQALNLPQVGSAAANAAGLKRAPRDDDFLYSLNLKPFIQLLALDSERDQAQALWFLKECALLRLDLAKAWFEPLLPRLRQLLHSDDRDVRSEAIGLYKAIGPHDLPAKPEIDDLDGWAERAERALFPPVRIVSESLVLLLPSPDRDAIAAAGQQALRGESIGQAVTAHSKAGKAVRGFRLSRVPDELKVLQLPEGAVVTSVNGTPVEDGGKLLALIEQNLELRRDRSGRVLNRQRSLLVEFLHDGETKAVEFRVL